MFMYLSFLSLKILILIFWKCKIVIINNKLNIFTYTYTNIYTDKSTRHIECFPSKRRKAGSVDIPYTFITLVTCKGGSVAYSCPVVGYNSMFHMQGCIAFWI